jgi:predicted amino acid dehydrogenase
MGVLGGGIRSADGVLERIYRFPVRDVAHGCLLEGAVLAIAQQFESFSTGRGRVTPARVEEMWRIATAAGARLAPLFDNDGLWPELVP